VTGAAVPFTAAEPIGWFAAAVLGVVEGLTEFLPVSSTGHLIVAQRLLGLDASEANNTFAVGIQIGAISAVLLLYWRRLLTATRTVFDVRSGQPNLLWQIAVAALPAVVLGLLCDDWIEAHLFSAKAVAWALLIGGGLLLSLERWLRRRPAAGETATISYATAFGIGLFQCLSLLPGTSRAGAMIAGGLLLGLSRTAAAEFSFLVGLPILYGAAGYKLFRHRDAFQQDELLPLVIGTVTAFVSALVVVRAFVGFLRRHTFVPFGWYRIAAGALLLLLVAAGHL
jgi:undecaprenyl-diphosphatase